MKTLESDCRLQRQYMLIRIRRQLPQICGCKTMRSKGVMGANPLLLLFSPGKIQAFDLLNLSSQACIYMSRTSNVT
jgi:hypothetical protein